MAYFIPIVLLLHGLIHAIGWLRPNNHSAGVVGRFPWMAACILFIAAAVIAWTGRNWWFGLAAPAVVLSQVLIFIEWKTAKAGTLVNLFILLAIATAVGNDRFEAGFRKDVSRSLDRGVSSARMIDPKDLNALPAIVRRYILYTGAAGKPVPQNMQVVLSGEMRSKQKDWFPFTSVQFNGFENPTRFFFMKGKMGGLVVPGYHHYIRGEAVMDIRLFGIIPVMQASGTVMNTTETVTLFNEWCLMAPGRLTDKRIHWYPGKDSLQADAVFTNDNISIRATLLFNKDAQLINFISNDRTEINTRQQLPFSTPCGKYKNFNGCLLPSEALAVWQYPEGSFAYGRFRIVSVDYDVHP
ncbi:MAG: hypothetical protein KGO82_01025 [Bacteroidota bacterium]|nr:hypothetical protein [Bacteroidota bacterium]